MTSGISSGLSSGLSSSSGFTSSSSFASDIPYYSMTDGGGGRNPNSEWKLMTFMKRKGILLNNDFFWKKKQKLEFLFSFFLNNYFSI